MKNLTKLIIIIMVFIGISCTQKTEIAQWRGLNRDGVFNETGLMNEWPEDGPQLLWEYEKLGDGYGSPAVTNDKLYINGSVDSTSYVFAFNLDGNIAWKTENGPAYTGDKFTSKYPGSRSTPTVVDNFVYSISGLGRIICCENLTGTEIWSQHMVDDLNGKPNYFGYAESPLISENKIFAFPGGKDTNIVALDRLSGDVLWVSKALQDTVAYCSPTLINLPTRKILVTFSIHNLIGLDAETGELLWSHAQKVTKYNQPANTPVFYNGSIYYAQYDGNGVVRLDISEDGTSIKEVWRKEGEGNTFTSFLVKDNKLFTGGHAPKLKAFDTNNGEIIDSITIKTGVLIAADNMMYCYSTNGTVNLMNSTDSMQIVSKFKIKKGSLEHVVSPVIKNGVLYIRHGNALMAYDIKQKEV